jgi:hypothetical protein
VIGVITPYRAQANLIRRLLKEPPLPPEVALRLKIGTVHAFQGSEADVIIPYLRVSSSSEFYVLNSSPWLIGLAGRTCGGPGDAPAAGPRVRNGLWCTLPRTRCW